MVLRFMTGLSIGLALLSAPVTLARYTPDGHDGRLNGASIIKASIEPNQTHHLLDLVATLARPAPVLAIGAPVLTQQGLAIGHIEDILVHHDIIQAVVSVPYSAAIEQVVMRDAPGPLLLMVPATAFETQSGDAVLAIPVEQLSHMQRIGQ